LWPRFLERWKGIALTLIGVVATLWLAFSGQLGLYIHPRYFLFTTIMAVIGGALAIVAMLLLPASGADEADHEHEHEGESEADASQRRRRPRGRRRALAGAWATVAILVGAGIALLALPPATLSAATAVQRDVERTTSDLANESPLLVGTDPSEFTFRDWALVVRQGGAAAELTTTDVSLVGFVMPAPDDPDDTFVLARFTITCCAVDAQPIGVPVHLPDWRERFSPDDWVDATGRFGADPAGGEGLVLLPTSLEVTDQPSEPYVY